MPNSNPPPGTNRSPALVVVGATAQAKALADALALPLVQPSVTPISAPSIVFDEDGRIGLGGFVEGAPFTLDLDRAASARANKRSDLARAVGVAKGVRSVVDVTAGLGRDAAALAALGLDVLAVERSPVLGAMWREALVRSELKSLRFASGDAVEVLRSLSDDDRPDAVYLDPMFPPRTKSALVGKELRTLSRLLALEGLFGTPEAEATDIIAVAREVARKRVVVKRPRRAPVLADGPAHQFEGTTVRFDLYLC